jgi:hypothetical protein
LFPSATKKAATTARISSYVLRGPRPLSFESEPNWKSLLKLFLTVFMLHAKDLSISLVTTLLSVGWMPFARLDLSARVQLALEEPYCRG